MTKNYPLQYKFLTFHLDMNKKQVQRKSCLFSCSPYLVGSKKVESTPTLMIATRLVCEICGRPSQDQDFYFDVADQE